MRWQKIIFFGMSLLDTAVSKTFEEYFHSFCPRRDWQSRDMQGKIKVEQMNMHEAVPPWHANCDVFEC